MDRYGRQARLTEVGVEGQARIAASLVTVRLDGLAADVAARYLAGAGVYGLRISDGALTAAAHAIAPQLQVEVDPTLVVNADVGIFELRDPGAGDVARGAHFALRALRDVIEGRS